MKFPRAWPGWLPPISLQAFGIAVGGVLWSRRKAAAVLGNLAENAGAS